MLAVNNSQGKTMAEENSTPEVAQPRTYLVDATGLNVTANIIDLAVQRGAFKRLQKSLL